MPSFSEWVHPAAAGGLPGRECMETALDAQILFERAALRRENLPAILLDYDNFFDRFDTAFFTQLFKAVNFPPAVCQLFSVMYAHIQRRLKFGNHLDRPLDTDCGAGQGDSFSLLGALCITTVEFRMLDHRWPRVHKGSVVDDRDLVGPAQDVVGATRDCLVFDKMAGLQNNPPKFIGLANNPHDRDFLASTFFEGHKLKVTDNTALVGAKLNDSSLGQAEDTRPKVREGY